MNSKEMVPGPAKTCKKEKDLLCWVRRELGLITLKTRRATMLNYITRILAKMNDTFDDWPEDPK